MQSAAIEACREAGIACASLFSNGPSYLTIPNANLSLALLRRLAALFQLDLDLHPLREAAETLTRQVSEAIEERSNAEFRDHLRRLEARFDAQAAPLAPGEVRRQLARQEEQEEASGPLNVDPQDVVRELEDFLRRRNQRLRQPDAGGEDAPPTPPGEGGEADDAGGSQELPPDAPPDGGGRP
jgi:hypothetical protein